MNADNVYGGLEPGAATGRSPCVKHTLYDDWLARRAELAPKLSGAGDNHHKLQRQILDYLLQRYRDSPLARRTSRSPPKSSLSINERAIVVHHHITGQGGGSIDEPTAEARVAGILSRMQSSDPGKETPSDAIFSSTSLYASESCGKLWLRIRRRIGWGFRSDKLISQALDECPYLPTKVLHHLYARFDRFVRPDTTALELFLRCENRGVMDLAARCWRRRIEKRCRDKVFDRLRDYFLSPENVDKKRQRLRRELGDNRSEVRMEAVGILSEIGTWEDIALLTDLSLLPRAATDPIEELDAMAQAIRMISERQNT